MGSHSLLWPLVFLLIGGCAPKNRTIGRSGIPDTKMNREIIKAMEDYRLAVQNKDLKALLLMSSSRYREDRGTAELSDDYTRKQLPTELAQYFVQGADIRYSMRYERIKWQCPNGKGGPVRCRALVEVKIDASFSMKDPNGREKRLDKQEQGRLVLAWERDSWKFEEGF